MAYNNSYQRDYNQERRQQPRFDAGPQMPAEIRPLPLPEDYVDAAEAVMRSFMANKRITTTKIRNLLSLVIDIYNTESKRTEPELTLESRNALMMARIRIAYEMGRERDTVGEFVKQAKLLEYIKDIGNDRKKLIDFAHYMEALVAYHRYLGGKES